MLAAFDLDRGQQLHGIDKHAVSGRKLQIGAIDARIQSGVYNDIHTSVGKPKRIALLIRAESGAMRSGNANLAAAITRHIGHLHVLSLSYSTHQDKGDSLLAFDSNGTPLQAYFLPTAVFRDAFSAV